jgi:hypothetical protein
MVPECCFTVTGGTVSLKKNFIDLDVILVKNNKISYFSERGGSRFKYCSNDRTSMTSVSRATSHECRFQALEL